MSRAGKIFILLTLMALPNTTAFADGPNRVTWKPTSSGSCENCNLFGRQMPFWNLKEAHYDGANFSYASLHGITADGAYFIGIKAQNVDLTGAQANNAHFNNALLENARLSSLVANGADFSDANLKNSDAREAILVGANLSNITASGMTAFGADFSAAVANGAIFDKATLRGAVFDGALLTGASFIGADLAGASFRDARLAEANLTGALNYLDADFSGACRSVKSQLPSDLILAPCEAPQDISERFVEAP